MGAVWMLLMCLGYTVQSVLGVSAVNSDDIAVIVDRHNYHRANTLFSAKKMFKMYWNTELADKAQEWADYCKRGHDSDEHRNIPGIGNDGTPGQNAAAGYADWTTAIDGWHSEESDHVYGGPNYKMVGHYTQVVRDKATLVGCGIADCPSNSTTPVYVCNYAHGNDAINAPYELGTQCAGCDSDVCDSDGLCDCGAKYCYNGGTMNSDCSCSCTSLTYGAECKDEYCPGLKCENGGDIDTSDCSCNCLPYYSGSNCEILTCPAADLYSVCGSDTPGWQQSDCDPATTTNSNAPYYCPIMCGICDAPPEDCAGVTCQNGGTLNTADCSCTCFPYYYSGAQCENIDCSGSDVFSVCGNSAPWRAEDCTPQINGNAEIYCPHTCGKC